MALQSQAPRAGSGRRYTANSKRGKKGLAPWLALLGVVVIIGGLIVLFGDPGDPVQDANAAAPQASPGNPQPAGTNTGTTTGTNSAAVTPPPPDRNALRPAGTNTTTNDTAARTPATLAGPAAIAAANDPDRKLAGEAKDQYELGMQRLEAGDITTGRALLSELLFRDGALPRHEAYAVRQRLTNLSEQYVFSAKNRSTDEIKKDPILTIHKVQSGEFLGPISNTYRVPYQLIERINGVKANRLQAGQSLQTLRGPVHARIDKSDYRMDLYVVDPDGLPIYLKSYVVGLGEFDSTPIGQWRVKLGSKVGPANGGPSWRNPRTGKVYDRNDPDIPIGEYWMALEGIDENTKDIVGYGIHATNDPESIGRQESMGCVRMSDKDVDEVFYTLFEGASTVEIVP